MSGVMIGDYVTIGDNALTWKVLEFWDENTIALLESGQSGIHRLAPIETLRLHSKGKPEPAF